LKKLNAVEQKRTILKIFKQIVEGVCHIHNAGLIHSDIKDLNIMVEKQGSEFVPIIIDLGSGVQAGNLSVTQSLLAREYTLSFAPPECWKNAPIDYSCDIWSLGCLFYFMATSFKPWTHETR
jgi:p90 ribosomal S6 kinase